MRRLLSVLALSLGFTAILTICGCKEANLPLPSASQEHSTGDSLPKIKKGACITWFGPYEPSTIKGWSSIPEPAKSRIVTHLKNRLGNDFYAKLSLVGGQIIDITVLHEKEPGSKNYKWEIPAYCLNLRLSRPGIGIDFYDARIDCRSDGSVINEIDLPAIAKYSERAAFISTSRAYDIAKQNGFDVANAEMTLEYRADPGVCVFSFMQKLRPGASMSCLECMDIDAHNGKVLKTYSRQVCE